MDADAVRELFSGLRVHAFGGVFHVPARDTYPALFAWDSAYHALALAPLEPRLAAGELRTLFASNRLPDGLLAHERSLPTEEARKRQAHFTDRLGPLWGVGDRSLLIDPPAPVYAAARVAPGLVDRAVEVLDAIDARRAVYGGEGGRPEGVPVILHPLESGTDASPMYGSLLPGDPGLAWHERVRIISLRAARLGWRAHAALDGGHPFVVADPTMLGWYVLAREATGGIERARAVTAWAMDHLWDGDCWGGWDAVSGRPLPVPTAAGALLAACDSVPLDAAERFVDRWLTPGSGFWGPCGVSFNPLDPDLRLDPGHELWAGNDVWGATMYWAHLALRRVGADGLAGRVVDQLDALVERHGFREYYDAFTGRPGGAGAEGGFSWPALGHVMRSDLESDRRPRQKTEPEV
ncbi:MAG: hypothetical protein KY434_05710 [Actinobacteria bacterium]|nr:hypothetical protein [Actinomycetota bacterium]